MVALRSETMVRIALKKVVLLKVVPRKKIVALGSTTLKGITLRISAFGRETLGIVRSCGS